MWLWSLLAFVVGGLSTWILFVAPARRQVTALADRLADTRALVRQPEPAPAIRRRQPEPEQPVEPAPSVEPEMAASSPSVSMPSPAPVTTHPVEETAVIAALPAAPTPIERQSQPNLSELDTPALGIPRLHVQQALRGKPPTESDVLDIELADYRPQSTPPPARRPIPRQTFSHPLPTNKEQQAKDTAYFQHLAVTNEKEPPKSQKPGERSLFEPVIDPNIPPES